MDVSELLRDGHNVFLISDPHFNHTNIIKYCGRPFKTVEEMDKKLIENWNSVVTDNDYIFCLGDFCLGSKEKIIEIGRKLNGHKILIMGNHCRATKKTYIEAGFEQIVKEEMMIFHSNIGLIKLSHHPKQYLPELMTDPIIAIPQINIHGHTHCPAIFTDTSIRHLCVCVEAIDYTPISINDLLNLWSKNIENS